MNITDFTGVVALKNVYDLYENMKKKIRIRNMSESSVKMCLQTKLFKMEIFYNDEKEKK